MSELRRFSRMRRGFLMLIPSGIAARVSFAQNHPPPPSDSPFPDDNPRLPNGRKQRDEILKADYEANLKDSQELVRIARSFEEDLEKNDRFVLSLDSLKKLDDLDKLTKRIRGRMKRF